MYSVKSRILDLESKTWVSFQEMCVAVARRHYFLNKTYVSDFSSTPRISDTKTVFLIHIRITAPSLKIRTMYGEIKKFDIWAKKKGETNKTDRKTKK
jgi:hypothetical protein